MVFYLSNRFTNPIMFGIILKSYLCSMLWYKFDEDIMIQKQKKYCEYMYCLYTGKNAKFQWKVSHFYLLKSVQNINNSSGNYIILYCLVGHNLVQLLYD